MPIRLLVFPCVEMLVYPPPRRKGEHVTPKRASVKGRTEVLLLFGVSNGSTGNISLLSLFGLDAFLVQKYKAESGPYKDVPQTVLKRGPWVKAVIQVYDWLSLSPTEASYMIRSFLLSVFSLVTPLC